MATEDYADGFSPDVRRFDERRKRPRRPVAPLRCMAAGSSDGPSEELLDDVD